MELRQLQTFRQVVALGSFTRAADALGYVQSNVTAHIQSLERELGVVLFDRSGRQVRPTDAGLRLARYADQILALAAEARVAVGEVGGGEVRISAPETLCTYRLPAFLRAARAELPGVRVVFRPMAAPALRRGVRAGDVDVAFTLEPAHASPGLRVEVLSAEPIVVIAPPDHRLAREAAVGPAELAGEPLLLTEAGCGYRAQFEQALAAAGHAPRELLEFSSVEAIKQCVIAGMGLAVLPEAAVARELRAGDLAALPWAGAPLAAATQLVWHTERWCSPTLGAFLALARATLGRGGEPGPAPVLR